MSIPDVNRQFESKYSDSSESIYEAIDRWAADAHKLNSKYDGRLSEKECLDVVVTNKFPDDFEKRKIVKLSEVRYVSRYIYEELTHIDDIDVKFSVKLSIEKTIMLRKLQFVYRQNLTESQKSRVRIIVRMLWNNLQAKKGTKDVRKLL